MTETKIKVPEQMIDYLHVVTEKEELERNAMIMYPYIKDGTLSHGRVAEILGVKKWDLIELYDRLGFPYLNSVSDYKDDLCVVEEIKGLF